MEGSLFHPEQVANQTGNWNKPEKHEKRPEVKTVPQSDETADNQKYVNDREELIALRNHLYHSTEDDIGAEPRIPVADMKKFLAEKKIVIIGGHSNWIRKLRKEFPQWIFYGAGSNNTADANVLLHSDWIFFFTDVLDHKTGFRC